MKSTTQIRTRNLTIIALLAAVSIILTRFLGMYIPIFGVNSVRVSFGNIPILLCGLLLGPLAGAITGIVADIVGATLLSAFGYFPGFTLSAAVVGFLPGIFKKILQKKQMRKGESSSSLTYFNILVIVLLTEIVASIILTTLWLSMTTGVSYLVLLAPRSAVTAIMSVVYSTIIYVLYKPAERML